MDIFLSMFSSAFLSLVLVWILRTWISNRLENAIRHEYAVKLEKLKTDMAKEQALSIERFKSECNRDLQERIIKFELLHAKTAEVLGLTYAQLRAYLVAVQNYVTSFQGSEVFNNKEENASKVIQVKNALIDYYRPNKIYLPGTITKKIDVFIDTIFKKAIDFRFHVVDHVPQNNPMELWDMIDKFMQKQAEDLFNSLENNFRRVLGHKFDSEEDKQDDQTNS